MARGRGRRVRPQPAQARARRSRSSPTPSSTTTRPTPPSATSTRRSARSSRSADAAGRAGGPRPPRRDPTSSRRADAHRQRLDLRLRRHDGHARRSRAPTTPQRRGGADRDRARGRRRRRPPARALAAFEGAGRRFERLGTTAAGALVVDDYAHHPTEVRATIEAARTLDPAPRRRLLPAAPVLAHAARGDARSARRSRSPTSRSMLDVYPARENAGGLSRASPACSSPRRPPTPAAASASPGCAPTPPPRPSCATNCAAATCC